MTRDEAENAMRELIPRARRVAATGGSMHPAWDVVFDAEAFIRGEQTLTSGPEMEVADKIVRWLDSYRKHA